MLIDWFTVTAQIINFLILVWLLKRFLYRPILDAIDARELRIAKTLEDAATKQSQAEKQQAIFSDKNRDFDTQRSALLESAIEQAEKKKQDLIAQARETAETLRSEQQTSLAREQKSLHIELGKKTQTEIFAISRQTLRDLADSDLEEQILKIFITRLSELDDDQKKVVSSALSTNVKGIRVRSAFILNSEQKKQLSKAVSEQFPASEKIDFDTSPEVISGIELTVNGQKLAWSIAHYIDELEKHLQQLVQVPAVIDSDKNIEAQ